MTEQHREQSHPSGSGLLAQDQLILQQVTGFLSNDFAITDPVGKIIGRVKSQGSALGRMIGGTRRLQVADADGRALLEIRDPRDLGLDRYEIWSAEGEQLLAHLQRKLSFFRTSAFIDLGGRRLDLEGDMLGFDFRMMLGETVAATVLRQWGGIGRGLLGHSRYQLQLHPQAPVRDRAAILGGVIALDLIRAKKKD